MVAATPTGDALIRLLEDIGANAWPAARVERLHGWRLGYDRGVTRRANSVLPNRWTGGVDPDTAIDQVERRYRARGLTPCLKLTRAAEPAGLDDILARRGYRREGVSQVLTADASAMSEVRRSIAAVDLRDTPSDDWIAASWPAPAAPDQIAARCAIVGRIRPPRAFALATRDGDPAGAALAVLEAGWAGITAVHTLPRFRRTGIARALVAALAAWALARRAPSLYLQVEADNRPARRLYAGAGFRPAYRYHYRTLPPPDRSRGEPAPRRPWPV